MSAEVIEGNNEALLWAGLMSSLVSALLDQPLTDIGDTATRLAWVSSNYDKTIINRTLANSHPSKEPSP